MHHRQPIAIVGMSGVFPGAGDLDTFWHNLVHKIDAAAPVPPERWIVPPETICSTVPRPDTAISRRACLIRDFEFDPAGLEIDKHLALDLDPLYHLVLHTGREAFANARTADLDRRRTGVILAAIALPTDAASALTRRLLGPAFAAGLTGKAPPVSEAAPLSPRQALAARVTGLPAAILARALGLGAGAFTLDAACASSLYAVKLACDELSSFRADAMLAGGVSRPECLYTQVGFSQLKALSPSGRCAPFDRSADGLVVGEGAGILVLKRLSDAMRDQDTIWGVIRGIGVSNDIEGNLLAPDTEGQMRAMQMACQQAGWSPPQVDHIECHGTGTPVGDAIELKSMRLFWGESGWRPGQCAIGSVKSMIGHTLTAAGAAGMIKTLLSFHHQTLPPSLNFSAAPPDSPLAGGPFRVQTEPEPWPGRKAAGRRAAVSAFGFGGINAHLLVEEFDREAADLTRRIHPVQSAAAGRTAMFSTTVDTTGPPSGAPAVAIVGMGVEIGPVNDLKAFQTAVLKGTSVIGVRPKHRFRGSDAAAEKYLGKFAAYGAFMDNVALEAGQFRIPPNQLTDILPQHLLMLKVAGAALDDAGLPRRRSRRRMGAVMGIGFDYEATHFHLRWSLANDIERWKQQLDLDLDDRQTAEWLIKLRDACGPPLTHARTMGALAGVIASRIAREFRLGGPSFTVSAEETAGLKALEIAVRSLQQNETDTMLAGAVDMAGDLRNVVIAHARRRFAAGPAIRPFDRRADGCLPADGAVCLVLKRLDTAIDAGDRIYAVIRGLGHAGSGGGRQTTAEAYERSLKQCLDDAGRVPDHVSYLEAHGSGDPAEDRTEAHALHAGFKHLESPCAIGSLKPVVGDTGAAAGLAGVVKTALCLYQEILPPLPGFREPALDVWQAGPFHFPRQPQYWLRNREAGPRLAVTAAMTVDGNCGHVLLEGCDRPSPPARSDQIKRERRYPLGGLPAGLFAVEGDSRREVSDGLARLDDFIKRQTASPARGASIHGLARAWHANQPPDPENRYAAAIVAADTLELTRSIARARDRVADSRPGPVSRSGNVFVTFAPLGKTGRIAFVFPGSGNHYVGMGRGIGIFWPEILRRMDARTPQLKNQLLPEYYVPWRSSWPKGWELDARDTIIAHPHTMIYGQVMHGGVMSDLVRAFQVVPDAVIGYSLGESAGYFASGAWPDRAEMQKRLLASNLFTTELAGPCNAARKVWQVPDDEAVDWCAAVVNRPAETVRAIIAKHETVRLLIVNTPAECVIGGRRPGVEAVIQALGCESVFLEGVVTVHCDAALPAEKAYRALHVFPTAPPDNMTFYSCARGCAHQLTTDSAADSILAQALNGFDFTTTIQRAWEDGIRIFLEMGPHNSCTRMIRQTLGERPHLAVSACARFEDDAVTLLKILGALVAERIPVDLGSLYPAPAATLRGHALPPEPLQPTAGEVIRIRVGGAPFSPPPPDACGIRTIPGKALPAGPEAEKNPAADRRAPDPADQSPAAVRDTAPVLTTPKASPTARSFTELVRGISEATRATADAHQQFLDFSEEASRAFARTFDLQNRLLQANLARGGHSPAADLSAAIQDNRRPAGPPPVKPPAFSRDMCMEFAVGSVARVLGPEFAVIDTYDARVRLPDEPLMLVDRILSVEGEKCSLGSGRLITEHDVHADAWYLDGDRAPVCISVEAGQADLFLCSYLGIDHKVKGRRTYRLLDAAVQFYRGLPRPGDVIRYEIKIDRFVRQGETYLFFFSFEGTIDNCPLITMTGGCAGFFTDEEVRNSGGILLTEAEKCPGIGKTPPDWQAPVSFPRTTLDDNAVEALRRGDLEQAFGPQFSGITLPRGQRLPGGRMKLIHRISDLDPEGGRWGLGRIDARADIHPDDWFLTCHFVDDPVMPGTLMYECCTHTLRVLLQRMGWITADVDAAFEPVTGAEARLKCRGPVTPQTREVLYRVELREIGYNPEPYVIADAHMYADGHHIVFFDGMSVKLTGADRAEIETFWQTRRNQPASPDAPAPPVRFDRAHMLEFAVGSPSKAFGPAYRPFDRDRFIARLPGPPYLLIHRVTLAEPAPWQLAPGGWIEAECDISPTDWYFAANRTPCLPLCILNEIALQPCGWTAAYLGSALKSDKDLHFRNLGGQALLHRDVRPEHGVLATRARLTRCSGAGDMIIEHFDFEIRQQGRMVYAGNTHFGFFTAAALAAQKGLGGNESLPRTPDKAIAAALPEPLAQMPPLNPGDPGIQPAPPAAMPARALSMVDTIEAYLPGGGPDGLGFIRGTKTVVPNEWFFKAHFFQDPVCPGSLGLESFVQLLKFIALKRWGSLVDTHYFSLVTGRPHEWTYRGQILPTGSRIEVDAWVTRIADSPDPMLLASGILKIDGLCIYRLDDFGLALRPVDSETGED